MIVTFLESLGSARRLSVEQPQGAGKRDFSQEAIVEFLLFVIGGGICFWGWCRRGSSAVVPGPRG
jgi:hypothetical protein